MKCFIIFIIFLLNNYISIKKIGVEAKNITCTGGTFKTTGEGDACCTINFWSTGTLHGGNVVPYDSKKQSCCKGETLYSGRMTIESSKLVNDSSCCLDIGYDNKTQTCCIRYSSKGRLAIVGYGDSCCGNKPYYRTTHGCCSTYSSIAGEYLYTQYDLKTSCCESGVVYSGKDCSSTSDKYKDKGNNGQLLKSNIVCFILFYFILHL